MTYEIVTVRCGASGPTIDGARIHGLRFVSNRDNLISPCQAYQQLLETSSADVIWYVHDDVDLHHNEAGLSHEEAIMRLFEGAPDRVVAVGLGGATALGNRDLYRSPFNIWNMARRGYASNQTDAETHGARFTGVRRVAVLDAFCMAVRTDWLRTRRTIKPLPIGGAYGRGTVPPLTMACELGWPVSRLTHHCLDLWLACEAARDRKEIWMVGASVLHSGGGTSTKPKYAEAKWKQGGTLESDHTLPHKWLYEEYRDVLPIEIE